MDEYIRLLICHTCKTIQEVPDFTGPSEHDDTLTYRVGEHQFPGGLGHFMDLGKVKQKDWSNIQRRRAIVDKIQAEARSPGEGVGLGVKFYDVKATFQEDAMDCWINKHGRRENCEDYRADKMRLYPDTRYERKSEGLDPKERPNTWLCDFCPVHSIVQQRQRKSKGMYDKQSWE